MAVCLRGGPGGLGVGKAWEPEPWSWKGPRRPSALAPGHAGRPRNLGRERQAEEAGAQLLTGPRSLDPGRAAYVAGRLGPLELLRLGAEEGSGGAGAAIPAYFLLHPLLGLSEIGPGQWCFGGGGKGVLSLPQIPPPWKSLGGTRIPVGAGVVLGMITDQGYP